MDRRRLEIRHGLTPGAALERDDFQARLRKLEGGKSAGQAGTDRNDVYWLEACATFRPPYPVVRRRIGRNVGIDMDVTM